MEASRKALKELTPSDIRDLVKASNLLGRGGAGFPTGVKWGLVPDEEEGSRTKIPCMQC